MQRLDLFLVKDKPIGMEIIYHVKYLNKIESNSDFKLYFLSKHGIKYSTLIMEYLKKKIQGICRFYLCIIGWKYIIKNKKGKKIKPFN